MYYNVFYKLRKTWLLIITLSQFGCITFSELRISKDSAVSKRPSIGCIENALDNFSYITFEKFVGSCTNELNVNLKRSTQCDIVTYRYYYQIPSLSRDDGFSALIVLELKNENASYRNAFQTAGHTNNLITNGEKKIIIDTLDKVDSHIKKVCGIDLETKLSISDRRPPSDLK